MFYVRPAKNWERVQLERQKLQRFPGLSGIVTSGVLVTAILSACSSEPEKEYIEVEADPKVVYVQGGAEAMDPDEDPDGSGGTGVGGETALEPPRILELSAFYNSELESVAFALEASVSASPVAVHVELLDEEGESVAGLGGHATRLSLDSRDFEILTLSQDELSLTFSALLPAGATGVSELRLRVEDETGALSEWRSVETMAPSLGDEGMGCDLDGVPSSCKSGLSCLEGVDGATCSQAEAPSLDAAQVYVNPHEGSLGVAVQGADADMDLAFAELVLFDDVGDEILPAGNSLWVPLTSTSATFDVFHSSQVEGVPLAQATSALVTLHDRARLKSASLTVEIQAPQLLASASPDCDLAEARGECPDQELCLSDGDGGLLCREVAAACPAGSAVELLSDAPVFGGWSLAGDNSDAASLLSPGRCVGGGGQSLFRFVAPETGSYLFALRANDPSDLVSLSLRRACDDGHVQVELSCSAGVGPQQSHALLEQGEELYLVVDGLYDPGLFPQGFEGQFVVSAERAGEAQP